MWLIRKVFCEIHFQVVFLCVADRLGVVSLEKVVDRFPNRFFGSVPLPLGQKLHFAISDAVIQNFVYVPFVRGCFGIGHGSLMIEEGFRVSVSEMTCALGWFGF